MKQLDMFPGKGTTETEYYRNKYLEALVEIDRLRKILGEAPMRLARSTEATQTQSSGEAITEEKEATPNVQVNSDKESISEFVQNQGLLKDPEPAYICGPCRTRMRMPQGQSSILSSSPRCYCLRL